MAGFVFFAALFLVFLYLAWEVRRLSYLLESGAETEEKAREREREKAEEKESRSLPAQPWPEDLVAVESGPEEVEDGRTPVAIKLVGLGKRITGYASNFLGSSTFLSQIEWSYNEAREHDLIFLFKKVRGLWAETVEGRAVLNINSEVILSRYNAAYDPGRKELLVSFLDGRSKQLKANGKISVKMTLGDNDRVIQVDSSESSWQTASESEPFSFSRPPNRPSSRPLRPIAAYVPPKISRPNQINFMCR